MARTLRDAELRGELRRGDAPVAPPATRPTVPAIAAPGKEPRATLWTAKDRAGLARALGDRPAAAALVSGRALDGAHGADAGFAWASAAGRAPLLAWIEATAARAVFVTGPHAESIVAALGPRGKLLGPPRQMTLFEAR